jgi:hypothetical protein
MNKMERHFFKILLPLYKNMLFHIPADSLISFVGLCVKMCFTVKTSFVWLDDHKTQ